MNGSDTGGGQGDPGGKGFHASLSKDYHRSYFSFPRTTEGHALVHGNEQIREFRISGFSWTHCWDLRSSLRNVSPPGVMDPLQCDGPFRDNFCRNDWCSASKRHGTGVLLHPSLERDLLILAATLFLSLYGPGALALKTKRLPAVAKVNEAPE